MKLPINYGEATPRKRKEVREEYVRIQAGCCWHCGTRLTNQPSAVVRGRKMDYYLFPPAFLDNPIHLHHNHDTGLTIGAVHARCNADLWQYFGE